MPYCRLADGKLWREQSTREYSCVLLHVGGWVCELDVSSSSRGAGAACCKPAAGKVSSVMSGSSKGGRYTVL